MPSVDPDPARRLREARIARLATRTPSGQPHLVPICFAVHGDVLYSAVDEKPKRSLALQRIANIRADSRVSVLVDHYDEDWSLLWWIRVDGTARLLEEGEERELALRVLTAKYAQYRATPPRGTVIAVEIQSCRAWAAAGADEGARPA